LKSEFYYHLPMYRHEQAMDGWKKLWAFLEQHLDAPQYA